MGAEFRIEFTFEGEEYKLPTLMLAEARAIQKVTGFTVLQFFRQLAEMDAEAITALIWVARKRQTPTLRFEEVDGDLSTFEAHDTSDEDGEADEGKAEADLPSTDAGQSSGAG